MYGSSDFGVDEFGGVLNDQNDTSRDSSRSAETGDDKRQRLNPEESNHTGNGKDNSRLEPLVVSGQLRRMLGDDGETVWEGIVDGTARAHDHKDVIKQEGYSRFSGKAEDPSLITFPGGCRGWCKPVIMGAVIAAYWEKKKNDKGPIVVLAEKIQGGTLRSKMVHAGNEDSCDRKTIYMFIDNGTSKAPHPDNKDVIKDAGFR